MARTAALVGGVAFPAARSIRRRTRAHMVAYTFRKSGDVEAIRIISVRRTRRQIGFSDIPD